VIRSAFAPAKINLFLHVGRPAADGYHPLSSWMVFADVGDDLLFERAEVPSLIVEGPFEAGVPDDDSNLIIKAMAALQRAGAPGAFAARLTKKLPPASGIGGGSSDAAATLRTLGSVGGLSLDDMAAIAVGLGADVPACLVARSLIAQGRGQALSPAPMIPPINAVLVNPGVSVSTREVFAAYDADLVGDERLPALSAGFEDAFALADWLEGTRNDLQAPAVACAPVIAEALATLARNPEVLIARMSGSGATVFALCADATAANAVVARIVETHPQWWCVACHLS